VTVRVAAVSKFVTVTVALGTTPPEASFTTPRIEPSVCAGVELDINTKSNPNARNPDHM
jgi:hypothetical protein